MKHWRTLLCLLAAVFAFNNCDLGTGGGTEAEGLSGQLVDPNGMPIADALVMVYGSDSSGVLAKISSRADAGFTPSFLDSTLTDANGRYSFPGLKNGRYNLEGIFQNNGDTQTVLIPSILLEGGINLGTDTLRIPGSILIQAQSNGAPLGGVQCYVPGSSLIAISDDAGRCLITGVPPGIFQVRLQYPGLLTDTSENLQVRSGVTTNAGIIILVANPALAPPQTDGLSATYDSISGVVTVSWSPVKVSDQAGYVVYRRQDISQTPAQISTNLVTDTVFRDTLRRGNGDDSRMLYLYQIKAQDKDGNLSALYSDPVGITAVPPVQQGQYFSVSSSTVALWTFNANSNGLFTDQSPDAFNLSNANNFALTPSPFDSASVFTGSASLAKSYLTYAHNNALTMAGTGQITYEARVYLTAGQSGAGAGGGWLMGTYDGVNLCLGSDGHFEAAGQKVRNGTGYWVSERSVPGIVPQNRWVNLAVAFDQSTGQAYGYIDGTPVQLYSTGTTNPITDPFRISTGNFFVGNDGQDAAFQFSGKIDEIRVSNSLVLGAGLPLLPSSAVANPSDTISHFGKTSSTVALWTFNTHNTNGTFTDIGSNGFNLSNAGNFTLAASTFDSAAVFTGAAIPQSYLSHPYSNVLTIGGTGQITYEARIYLTRYPSAAQGNVGWIVGTYDGVSLNINSNGQLEATGQKVNGGGGYWIQENSAPGAVPLNRWVDIAVAFDQATGETYGYINGSPVQLYNEYYTSNADSDPFRVSTGPFFVGNNGQDSYQFVGQIDEIRVSNNLVLGAGLPLVVGNAP